MNISNTTFIITGASSGIGEALSKKLAAGGANVVLAARNKSKLNQVHYKIQNYLDMEQVKIKISYLMVLQRAKVYVSSQYFLMY